MSAESVAQRRQHLLRKGLFLAGAEPGEHPGTRRRAGAYVPAMLSVDLGTTWTAAATDRGEPLALGDHGAAMPSVEPRPKSAM